MAPENQLLNICVAVVRGYPFVLVLIAVECVRRSFAGHAENSNGFAVDVLDMHGVDALDVLAYSGIMPWPLTSPAPQFEISGKPRGKAAWLEVRRDSPPTTAPSQRGPSNTSGDHKRAVSHSLRHARGLSRWRRETIFSIR
jgi:hypothetical protein